MQSDATLKSFLSSETGRQALEQHRREQMETRRSLVDQIEDIKKRRRTELASLEDEATTAAIDAERARQAFEKAELHRRALEGKLHQKRGEYELTIQGRERKLRETAPPEIDAFIRVMREETDALRKRGISTTGDGKQSNRLSIEARLAAVRRAIDEAEKMKTHVDDDLPGTLNRMRSALPEVAMAPVNS